MKTDGDASGPAHGFVHKALIYGSDEEFIDVALPFVEDGLEAREPMLVAVQHRHIENVRAALGGTPDALILQAVEEWHETSARTRDRFARWTSERLEGADHVRLMAEPPWATENEARIRDWARHESVINV